MGSALPSNAIPYIARDFGVESESQLVLPISMYLIGENKPSFPFFSSNDFTTAKLTLSPTRLYLR